MTPQAFVRTFLLWASQQPHLRRWARRHGRRLGAYRFVAGETLDECVQVLRRLTAAGVRTNTTLLGEGVREEGTAAGVRDEYLRILDRLAAESLPTNISLKLTHLGLDLGEDVAYRHLRPVVHRAARLGTFVRIDMEESFRVDPTLRIYRRLRDEGYDNVGAVLQAYLYRTERDLEALLPLRPNLRLVKGAYLEPPQVAYPRKADVDRAYVRLMERMLLDGGYTAVATHDERIIDHAAAFTRGRGIAVDRYEFQMLYGVRPGLQAELVRRGFRVLVATPFGRDWFPYFMRRLAERPANVGFVLRSLLRP